MSTPLERTTISLTWTCSPREIMSHVIRTTPPIFFLMSFKAYVYYTYASVREIVKINLLFFLTKFIAIQIHIIRMGLCVCICRQDRKCIFTINTLYIEMLNMFSCFFFFVYQWILVHIIRYSISIKMIEKYWKICIFIRWWCIERMRKDIF